MRPAVVSPIFALLVGALLCTSVLAASSFELAAKGQKQGDIAGAGKTITVDGFTYEFVSPRDPASGLPTGMIMNRPLRVHKALDATSPKLLNALVTNENLPTVVLIFTRPGPKGPDEEYARIKLTDASIAGIRGSKGSGDVAAGEEVTFTYASFEYLMNTTANATTNMTKGRERPVPAAPFNVTIGPAAATVRKGQNVKFTILITAQRGFEEPVNLTLKLKDAPLLGDTYELGPYGPPYPYTLNYTFLVPSNIPFGIDLAGTLEGTSGAYVATSDFSLTIEGPVKFLGNGLNWLFSVPSKVGRWFE